MAALEGLLGALQGFGDFYAKDFQRQADRSYKEEDDKKKFQRDLLKGILIQSARPKGKNLSFGDDLMESHSDLFDPEFMKEILGAYSRFSGGTGGGKTSGAPNAAAKPSPFGPQPAPATGSGLNVDPEAIRRERERRRKMGGQTSMIGHFGLGGIG